MRAAIEGGRDPYAEARGELAEAMRHAVVDPARRPPENVVTAIRAATLGHALASRDWGAVASHEIGELDDALRQHFSEVSGRIGFPSPTPPRAPRQPDGPETVSFACTWRDGRDVAASLGEVVVTPLATDEVTVGARLEVEGGTLDALVHGGRWLRPVLAPGSWLPMSLDDFAAAAASGPPWGDNPFLAEARLGGVNAGVSEYATRVEPVGRVASARAAKAMAASLDRAGPLFVVGGVVHREAPEPELVMARVMRLTAVQAADAATENRLVWRMGALDSGMTMRTARPDTHPFDLSGLKVIRDEGDLLTEDALAMRFPLARHAQAAAVASRFASLLNRLRGGVPTEAGIGAPVRDVAVEDHDPAALLSDVAALFRDPPVAIAMGVAPPPGWLTGQGAEVLPDDVEALRLYADDVLPEGGASRWDVETPAREWLSALSSVAADAFEARFLADRDEVEEDVRTFRI